MSASLTTLNLVGFDPSLSNWGMALGHYTVATQSLTLSGLHIEQTQKSARKTTRVNTSDLDRAQQLATAAMQAASEAHVIFVEVPHGSQSSRASVSYGICVGILACLRQQDYPFIQVSADDVKQATVGNSSATKQQIVDRAIKQYPALAWPTQTQKGKTNHILSKCEHLADAIGAIEAGIQTQEFKQLIRTLLC